MAGAGKRRNQRERHAQPSSNSGESDSHASSKPANSRSTPHQSSTQSPSVAHSAASHSDSPDNSKLSSLARFDGNRDPEPTPAAITGNARNIDLPGSVWSSISGRPVHLPSRPKPSTLGKEVLIGLNTFNVVSLPKKDVWQYDILAGSGAEKRGLVMKLWESKAVKDALGGAKGWLFDGNKLAWSLTSIDREIRVQVDLDGEQGRPPSKTGRANVHRVVIKKAKKLGFQSLQGYLDGTNDWDKSACLETITFCDHLLREQPRQKYTAIKRSFFAATDKRTPLAPGIEHMPGVYQSIRIAHQSSGLHCMTINVDVANGTFWTAGPLKTAIMALTNARSESDMMQRFKSRNGSWNLEVLKRLNKLYVFAEHRKGEKDTYVIKRFLKEDSRTFKFPIKDTSTGKETQISLYDYFIMRYNIRLNYPDWPVIEMTKKRTVVPIEILKLKPEQRYVFKLDEKATSNMIKVAVTAPADRWGAVEHGLRMLDWKNDKYLTNYGMHINDQRVIVKGRVLNAPEVTFQNGANRPGTSGRWDVRNKKFLTPNVKPLKSWGFCVMPSRQSADTTAVKNFVTSFVRVYSGHGGRIESRNPPIFVASSPDPAKAVEEAWMKIGNTFNTRPQIMFFILQDKDSQTYGRIKKSAECRYGVISQCMQMTHVAKNQDQYHSNICLKVNTKLGGSSARAIGAQSKTPTGLLKVPTMIIGADVSHAAPGAQTASMAAITASMDVLCTRYAAACNTNGYRVEMITPENITKLIKPLIQQWNTTVGKGQFPRRIIYFRDGVSEGQFAAVINQEVKDMKNLLATAGKTNVAFTVIVASKRHHIRFFPADNSKDKSGNALPGTLVETGVTHPYDFDFYLCSHAAIKGTARPAHYHVLLNEAGDAANPALTTDAIHQICYEHVYQYCRATTPVSLHPAVYYAHLASKRAIHHDRAFGGGSNEKDTGTQSSDQIEVQDLMVMPNEAGINFDMWYV